MFHGLYYTVAGLWSLFNMDTFQLITGRKRDLWLVQTVGALLAVIGGTLFSETQREQGRIETVALGAGSAITLATVNVVYYRRGVYPVDTTVEIGLAVWWLDCGLTHLKTGSRRRDQTT